METMEYFEKVMQGFRSAMPLGSSKNQHRNGRSLRKYCQDEGIDYKWLQEYRRTYKVCWVLGKMTKWIDLSIIFVNNERKLEIDLFDLEICCIFAPSFNTD